MAGHDSGAGGGSGGRQDPGAGQDDPEAVLSQALRAMAGGERTGGARGGAAPVEGNGGAGPGLTRTQILLIAAIVGLVIGMAAGFTVLAMR